MYAFVAEDLEFVGQQLEAGEVIEVTPKIDMHWGKPDFERV